MPYQVTKWACTTCHTEYVSQTEAQRCERTGSMPLEHQVGDRVRCMSPVPGCYGKAARVQRIEFMPQADAPHLPLYKLRFEHDADQSYAGSANTLVGLPEDAPQDLPCAPEVWYDTVVPPTPVSFWRRVRDAFVRRVQRDR